MDYKQIKRLSKRLGVSYKDLIVLAPQNDPFYAAGTPGNTRWAQWFTDLWQRFGYSGGIHLRRIHYQILSQDPPVLKPDGSRYENTENNWNYLDDASKYARYLNLVPASAFIDRRNPEAIIYAYWGEDPEPSWSSYGYGSDWQEYRLPTLPTLPDLPFGLPSMPGVEIDGYGVQQPYHVEVWAEKTTMNDVLSPLCRRYGVNLITGAGELSITAVLALMERAAGAKRPARVLYVSDYDPAGHNMPVTVARKIEFFQREFGFADLDFGLDPILLTAEQVEEYRLPRVPIKDSDLRKANWQERQGSGAVELDALEALRPGVLAEIVREAIFRYHDDELGLKAREQYEALSKVLDDEREQILENHEEEIEGLRSDYEQLLGEFGQTQERFAELIADFQPELDAYCERLEGIQERGRDLYSVLLREIDDMDVGADDYPLPEPDLPPEGDLLYASGRDYLAQLEWYAAHRDGRE